MSMHKVPLTQIEEEGLRCHGLDIGTPSQLSDVFRHGVAWGQKAEREACAEIADFSNKWIGEWALKYGNMSVGEAIRERSNA